MKKMLIILIMILITHLLISNDIISDIEKGKWDKLSDIEKWESYKVSHNSYVKLKVLYDKKNEDENLLLDNLEETNKILKFKWYPKYGLDFFVLCGLDQKLEVDIYTNIVFKKYFLKGHVYLDGGLGVKIKDQFGGSLILGLGFNW